MKTLPKEGNMTDWKPYTPTFTNLDPKTVKLPNGNISSYYWSRFHVMLMIVTMAYEYQQEGKIVNLRSGYKRLNLWDSLKFIIKTKITKEKP